jgi:hypothetical protein
MRVKIYQIDQDTHGVKFMDYDFTINRNGKIYPDTYKEVFNADIDETDLEAIYTRFNTNHHPLFRGHSLSVSDVVVSDNGAFFVDSIGFKQIVFDETKTQKPENLLKVVYVEPHRCAFEAEVENELNAVQKAVGGCFEPVYNGDNTIIICNDEAKYRGMDGNRRINNGDSIIAGPFFVCGDDREDFRSLTDAEVKKYLERFGEPEDISRAEVEADTGFTFYPC